jgi:hypothetical protein
MANATYAFVGGGTQSGPEVLHTEDGGDSFTDETPAPDSLLVLDCAAWSEVEAICSGIASIQHTTDGRTWEKSIDFGGGQSAERLPEAGKGFAVVAGEAVHASHSGSELFEEHKFTGIDTTTYPGRYGAYPSTKVWYVSAGKFATAPPPAPSADYDVIHHMSELHSIRKDRNTGAISHHYEKVNYPNLRSTLSTYDFLNPNVNASAGTHYGNPFNGACQSDETNVTNVAGGPGAICLPECGIGKPKCPKDEPTGMSAPADCFHEFKGHKYVLYVLCVLCVLYVLYVLHALTALPPSGTASPSAPPPPTAAPPASATV